MFPFSHLEIKPEIDEPLVFNLTGNSKMLIVNILHKLKVLL